MPMHDWTRVAPGVFHNFRFLWVAKILDRLNLGVLPAGFYAMAERVERPLQLQAAHTQRRPAEQDRYAELTNHISVRHSLGKVVAVIEVVSPGNKDRQHSLDTFIFKVGDLLDQDVNVLIIDPFPPGKLDPEGMHGAIWRHLTGQSFELPTDKPLSVASYQAEPLTAYVETISVGEPLPEMSLFLEGDSGISVPLEETYQTTWNVLPEEIRQLLE